MNFFSLSHTHLFHCGVVDMYFLVELQREVKVLPKHLGPNIMQTVKLTFKEELEGTFDSRYGYIVRTLPSDDAIEMGTISPDTGCAHFNVKCSAIVCRLIRGETVLAVVTEVSRIGFFAEVGPIQVMVPFKSIPQNMSFDATGNGSFVSSDGSVRISKEDAVRILIIGTRFTGQEMIGVGSIKEPYLGRLNSV